MKRLFTILLISRAAIAASWFDGSIAPERLLHAHRAYLAGDGEALVRDLTTYLRDSTANRAGIANAVALWRSAEGNLPLLGLSAEWRKRRTASRVRLVERRVEQTFQLALQGDSAAHSVKDVELFDARGQTILSRSHGRGEWRDYPEKAANQKFGFELRSNYFAERLAEGTYRIHIVRDDGVESNDWILFAARNGALPTITMPVEGQTLTTENPIARWDCERGELEVRVLRLQGSGESFDERLGPWWGAFLPAGRREIAIGTRYQNGVGFGEPALQDGAYALRVASTEVSGFGPTEIARERARVAHFRVLRGKK